MLSNFNSKSVLLHFPRIFTSLRFSTSDNIQNKSLIKKESNFNEKRPSTLFINSEDKQIQQFVRKNNKINNREKFGSLSKNIRMPQTEKVKTGFQSNIWDKGIEVIRFVKEREKTFREKLEDDFCEGRAVQVEEPLYVTFKHALKKDLKLKRMRAERKKDAKEQQVSSR
uniref:Uncharacterized protein n=1 Tax=Meloidogyne enterolobii TaxID=390850 RepID=A0A6V7WSA5_MELEN|nr:unnamed protein product [Meloidogyne enterolobii]